MLHFGLAFCLSTAALLVVHIGMWREAIVRTSAGYASRPARPTWRKEKAARRIYNYADYAFDYFLLLPIDKSRNTATTWHAD